MKRVLISIAIISFALMLSVNTFGQSNRRSKTTKNARTNKNPTQVTGGTIPVYKNGKNSAKRKTIGNRGALPESPWSDDYWGVKNNKTRKTNSKRKRNK